MVDVTRRALVTSHGFDIYDRVTPLETSQNQVLKRFRFVPPTSALKGRDQSVLTERGIGQVCRP